MTMGELPAETKSLRVYRSLVCADPFGSILSALKSLRSRMMAPRIALPQAIHVSEIVESHLEGT